jgi:hypothetical protein
VGRDVGAVDLGVVVELAVDLTQGPHRARRFEGAGVDVDVRNGDGVGLVSQVVEEAGDVPAFSAVGEIDGDVGVGVEVEVPGGLRDLALLVIVGTRQRCFHGGQADHVIAIPQGVREAEHRGQVVADHGDRALNPELAMHELVQVGSHRPLVVAVAGLGGSAGSPVVGYDDPIAGLDQKWHQRGARRSGLRGTVDEPFGARTLAGSGQALMG